MGGHSHSMEFDKKLWFVKVPVVASLVLQVLLLLLASFRKRTASGKFKVILFVIYHTSPLLAAWALRNILGFQDELNLTKTPLRLWATFMLLHLSGQEHLSVYSSPNDNNGWQKYVFGIVCYFCSDLLTILKCSITSPQSPEKLWQWSSTKILFCLALFRLLKTTLHSRLGSSEMSGFNLLPDDSPPLHKKTNPLLILEDHPDPPECVRDETTNNEQEMNTDVELGGGGESTSNDQLDDSTLILQETNHENAVPRTGQGNKSTNEQGMVINAHSLLLGSSLQRLAAIERDLPGVTESFKNMNFQCAIRTVEVELNFMYESFHTEGAIRKTLAGKYSTIIYALVRFVFGPLLCWFTWYSCSDSNECDSNSGGDYTVTLILLWGTMILEFLSFLLTVFSDWTVAAFKDHPSWGSIILLFIPHAWNWRLKNVGSNDDPSTWVMRDRRVFFRRWSETISKLNFYAYSRERPGWTGWDYFTLKLVLGLSSLVTSLEFVSSDWYSDELGKVIFEKLKSEATKKETPTQSQPLNEDSYRFEVLKWHLVTEILYNFTPTANVDRNHSKLLSDYMTYLLFKQDKFLSTLGDSPMDECNVAKAYIHKHQPTCQYLLQNHDQLPPGVLKEAVEKANSLRQQVIYWGDIRETWMDLLLHAAIKCQKMDHLRGLGDGGELISIVWLLAVHFNLC